MRPTPSTVLLVALLILLAGCGAASQSARTPTGASVEATERTTHRPETPATSRAPTLDDGDWVDWNASLPAELPPGVSDSGVDADALLAAHGERLAGTGFVVARNTSSAAGEGGVRARVTADRSRVFLRYDTTGPDRDVYLTGDRMFVRTHRGDETSVRSGDRTPNASSVPDDFRFEDRLRSFLDNAAHEPVGTVERDGRTLVVLEADTDDARGAFTDEDRLGGNLTALRSQVLVAPDGTVVDHRAVLAVTGTGGDTVTTEYRYAVDVGNVSVDRPAWATAE